MFSEFSLQTERENFYPITEQVRAAVTKSGIQDGIVVVYCPHTTAGITINENADPDVVHDLLLGLDRAFPEQPEFRHREGNSCAHLKSTCVGASKTVILRGGKLVLGVWQNIYFCEFDGPRVRKFFVKVIEG
jgi:secondary thiamine-phosphate synthase enzyme